MPDILMLQCYRQTHGDVDVPPCPLPSEPFDEVKRIASDHLLGHHKSAVFQPGQQPHTLDIVGEDGFIWATLMVRLDGSGGLHIVEQPNPSRAFDVVLRVIREMVASSRHRSGPEITTLCANHYIKRLSGSELYNALTSLEKSRKITLEQRLGGAREGVPTQLNEIYAVNPSHYLFSD